MNIIVPGWIESIKGIIAEYNSGSIDGKTAAAELLQLRGLVYDAILKYNHTPGVDWAGGGSQPGLSTQKLWTAKCDKHCTIGCCLFNGVIGPSCNNAVALVLHGQLITGTNSFIPWNPNWAVPAMPAMSKYGFVGSAAFTLSVNK